MAPRSMCATCKAIPFVDLPAIDEHGFPHLPSFDSLEASAENCPLCALLCYALGCSMVRGGGGVTFTPTSTLPSGKKFNSQWDGSMSRKGMRVMENGAVTVDFSPMKVNLDSPLYVNPRDRVQDGSKVRPWLYSSWYKSPFGDATPWLVGLGVRLGEGPGLEDAVGLVETDNKGLLTIRVPGTYLRVRADEGASGADIIPGRLRLSDQSSKRAITRVKAWIELCDKCHRCNNGHACASDPASPFLPTRVLDVRASRSDGSQGVRLIETNNVRDHYIALSHCWGTSHRLTTVKANLGEHLEHIPFSGLARTFQDAVILARELEIRYVWIDSLCIVQDDYADWEREAVRMGDVYSNAYLTIAALSSKDDSDGIFAGFEERVAEPLVSLDTISTGRRSLEWAAPLVDQQEIDGEEFMSYMPKQYFGVCDTSGTSTGRDPPRIYITPEWMPTSTKSKPKPQQNGASTDNPENEKENYTKNTETYLIGEFGGAVDPFADAALSKRGWTLQERVLARRTLHYGVEEMYWECQSVVFAEDGSLMRRVFPTREVVLGSRVSADSTEEDQAQSKSYKGRDTWYKLVEEYCARDLTRSEDKLPALAGLASSIASRSGDTYHAGLWRGEILEGLSWSVQVNEPSHQCDDPEHDAALPPATKSFPTYPSMYRAPSWSWAAFDAKIEFHPLTSWHGGTDKISAEVIDVRTINPGSNPFGRVAGGWLKLKAPLYAVRNHIPNESTSRRRAKKVFTQNIELVSKSEGIKPGSAVFDDSIQLPCFAIGLSDATAILLESYVPKDISKANSGTSNSPPTFRRIGRVYFYGGWLKDTTKPSGTSDPSKPQSPSLSGRFGRMFLGKVKNKHSTSTATSGSERANLQQHPQRLPDSELWKLADGTVRTVVLY